MGLACVDSVGAGVWAQRGHKGRSAGRVSRRLFGAADPDRNVQFARQQLAELATQDDARWNFDFQTMTPLTGTFSWAPTDAAPLPYQPHAHTASPDALTHLPTTTPTLTDSQTSLPNDVPTCNQTHLPNDVPTCNVQTHLPNAAPTPTELTQAAHTTCLTLPTPPPRGASPSTPLSQANKPVKRLQQKLSPKVPARKITDYFTEGRTPRLTDRVKVQLKADLLDSSTVHLATRNAELRLEDPEN